MGLEGLCSYKYILRGHGDIVGDFAAGRLQLHASQTPVKGESGMIKRGLALLVLLCMALPCAGMAEQTEARRVVYLTFDDGPKKDTPELLETLSELDVPATFFLVGLSVRAFPGIRQTDCAGGLRRRSHTMAHSIGPHSKGCGICAARSGAF